jgi:hypothetical protein
VRARSYRWSVIDFKIDTHGCSLGQNVANLGFEQGVAKSAVLVMLRKLIS